MRCRHPMTTPNRSLRLDPLDREHWQIVQEVLDGALDLPPERVGDHLARACAGDPELRAAVEQLLAHDAAAGGLLDRPVGELAPALLTPLEEAVERGPAQPDQRIGP